MAKVDLIEAVASLAEAETNSRPSLAGMDGAARIPIAGLKLGSTRGAVWTPEEDAFLRTHLGILPIAEISRSLGRTEGSVHLRWERDLHLASPRRDPRWLTLEAFAQGLGVDSHSVILLVDRSIVPVRPLPITLARSDGRRGIRVIDRKAALEWVANPMHWVYFKPDRVGTFKPQGRRGMAKPDVVFWRTARAAIDERLRIWEDAWLKPTEAALLIGLPLDTRSCCCHGINKAINLGLLPAARWGNWWILRSELLKFAQDRVTEGWGPRKIKRIRFSIEPRELARKGKS